MGRSLSVAETFVAVAVAAALKVEQLVVVLVIELG